MPTTAPSAEEQLLADWAYFKTKVQGLVGIDLNSYRPAQMMRRLRAMMQRCGADNFRHFATMLASDQHLRHEFVDFLTINVSEFYRNPDKFDQLRQIVLPQLLAGHPRLRVWSAGCSYGAEPYTVAMTLMELTPKQQHYILATDLDEGSLKRAVEASSYTSADLHALPKSLLRHFAPVGGSGPLRQWPSTDDPQARFQLSPDIRRLVTFRRHNLLKEPFEREFDLILCRNVVIYFTDEAKRKLYQSFYDSLRPGGVLFIGGTEMLANAAEIGFTMPLLGFHQKKSS